MSPEEADAIAAVETACPWLAPGDILAIINAPDDQKKEMLLEYKLSEKPPSATDWAVVLAILGTVGSLAGAVTGISGAVEGVYGLVQLIK
jgi:hypothetical protein